MSTGGTASGDAELFSAARRWLEQDPDEVTRAELQALLESAERGAGEEAAGARAELAERFGSRLAFGTAGLRGELGAGPNRMNRVLVAQAAAGLAAYLLAEGRSEDAVPSILIGFDGRTNSDVFARDTAQIMAGAGVRAVLLPRALPTPVLAFGVRLLGVSAGVMVTASHNPPRDNGYKVYLGGADAGSQIVSPVDARIEAEIVRAAEGDIRRLPRSSEFEVADERVLDEYVRRTAQLAPGGAPAVRFVYTAMHGIGWETMSRVVDAAGLPRPVVVERQIQPDAAFPTLGFPNPEEPGAMDLAIETAVASGAELVVANDPDADRLAVAIPDGTGWRRLSGNELGILLGWRAAERAEGGGTLAASLVSSPALGVLAREYGLGFTETLTGFKWISRVPRLVYGYEEALGYLVDPDKVRDKDGISAAIDVLALAGELKADGRALGDRLLEAADRFGAFASAQVSLRVREPAEISRLMARLRSSTPDSVGGVPVERVDDFAEGFGSFPPGDILRLWLAGGSRIVIRPSGTEPKLKAYIDAASSDGTARQRVTAAEDTVRRLERGVRDLLS